MKDLLDFIARSLVDDPSGVHIKQSSRGQSVHFDLMVAKEDMGRVIGKGGRVANAMRNLLRVAAAQDGKRASLDIVDPD
jgi:uncharacterized protein